MRSTAIKHSYLEFSDDPHEWDLPHKSYLYRVTRSKEDD